MDNVTLALHLLCERAGPASFWLPYIRTLPQEYDTPLFYEQEEVQLLQGTQALQDVLSQYRNTARQYAYFYKLIQVSDQLMCHPKGPRGRAASPLFIPTASSVQTTVTLGAGQLVG